MSDDQDRQPPSESKRREGDTEGRTALPESGYQNSPQGRRWPRTAELRETLTRAIHDAMSEERYILIPAPTSSGKSYNGATTAWRDEPAAGGKPVVHLHYTKDAREEAVKDSAEAGVSYRVLKGREEACPVVAGDYDDSVETPTDDLASDWFERQFQRRGTRLSVAHDYLASKNGGTLPCEPCESAKQWEDIPYDGDNNVTADVIHATHAFAHVPSLVYRTNLFIDEQPNFQTRIQAGGSGAISRDRFREIVVAWLEEIDAPVNTWEAFVERARENDDRLGEVVRNDRKMKRSWLLNAENAHAIAPALTVAMYNALTSPVDRNGRRVGQAHHKSMVLTRDESRSVSDSHKHSNDDTSADPRYNRSRITLIIDKKNRPLTFWNVPELGTTRSIIGLDAWPSVHEWKQNVGDELEIKEIVPRARFERWRKFERGLETAQIGTQDRPASTERAVQERVNFPDLRAVIDSLRDEYGENFRSIIFPKALEEQLLQYLPDDMRIMTLGNVKSNNDFSDEPQGLVTNTIDPGDDAVLNMVAAQGLEAEPETMRCSACDGDGCPECDDGVKRAYGRGFVGPDSDRAEGILAGIRANGIAQAIGRWARDPDSPRALVFVRTAVAPPEMIDTRIENPWVYTENQASVIDYLRRHPQSGVSAREVVEEGPGVNVTKRSAQATLNKLFRYGFATRIEGAGPDGANLFTMDERPPETGILDLSEI